MNKTDIKYSLKASKLLLFFFIIILVVFIVIPCFASDVGGVALDILRNSGVRHDFARMSTFELREKARLVEIISLASVFIIGIILLIRKIIKKQKFRTLVIGFGVIIFIILAIIELYIANLS